MAFGYTTSEHVDRARSAGQRAVKAAVRVEKLIARGRCFEAYRWILTARGLLGVASAHADAADHTVSVPTHRVEQAELAMSACLRPRRTKRRR